MAAPMCLLRLESVGKLIVKNVSRLFRRTYRQSSTLTRTCLCIIFIFLVYFLWSRILPVGRETYRVTIWANDFHISPIRDVKNMLQPLGVTIIDQSLSAACSITGTCAKGLRILNSWNGIPLPDDVKAAFYESYKDDPFMNTVNAFVCFHPASMCELFVPFRKSLLVIATVRYELGRREPERWKEWNANLIRIAQDPRNVVAANNLYDAEYIRYFTGVEPIVLESFCGYVNTSYSTTKIKRTEYLLAPIHAGTSEFEAMFMKEFKKFSKFSMVEMKSLRELYPSYKFTDLVSHPGIVYVPYQVSYMSLFEQYRMSIPLFFPSLDLLTEWQYKYMVLNERTWDGTRGMRPRGSRIPGVIQGVPDPNSEMNKTAIKYWLKYADFYQWPHITYYNSIEDLVVKLEGANLEEISRNMKERNAQVRTELIDIWKTILKNIQIYT